MFAAWMISSQLLALVMQKELQEKIQILIQAMQQPKMKTLPQAFISDFYVLGSALQSLRSLPKALLDRRHTLKPNCTSEFKTSPSDSGEPKEHACTGTAHLKRGPEFKKKEREACKLCREARQRMQILTYFSLLAWRGHEAAAIAAPQAQKMSRSPAKISAVMPPPDTGLLHGGCSQGRGNRPSAQAT